VIVVDDGSTDSTAAIARQYDCRLIQTENRGLASARNTGLAAAAGEIVAYTDDDAYPDPHWLTYLAATFLRTSHAAVGGPNPAPPPWSGTTAETRSAPTGNSRSGTAGRRRCSSGSGPRSTMVPGTCAGPVASTAADGRTHSGGVGRESITASGASRRISRSMSP